MAQPLAPSAHPRSVCLALSRQVARVSAFLAEAIPLDLPADNLVLVDDRHRVTADRGRSLPPSSWRTCGSIRQ
jgi:hypothetical protein